MIGFEWSKRHVNWAWWIGRVMTAVVMVLIISVGSSILSNSSQESDIFATLVGLLGLGGWVTVDSWYLHEKNRSYLWLLLTLWIGIFTLVLENKNPSSKEHQERFVISESNGGT